MNHPQARMLTSSEVSALTNDALVQRWESLNNGALRDQLSIDEFYEQERLVLKEMGIRFPKMYRDFLTYIVAPDRTLESLKRTNQDLYDLGDRLIDERDSLKLKITELESVLKPFVTFWETMRHNTNLDVNRKDFAFYAYNDVELTVDMFNAAASLLNKEVSE